MNEKTEALFAEYLDGNNAARYEYLLVLSRANYDRALTFGYQAILPSTRFSETDDRGAFRRFLGPLNKAWRWRRYLLNDGITSVDVRRLSPQACLLVVGAALAGCSVRFSRE